MPWADEAEVLALTGANVDPSLLTQAQGVIDLFAGVTEAASVNLSTRNARLLRMATAYQAAWMHAQVDVTSRTDVARVEQDGVVVLPANADALVLAPLAARALSGLSWRNRQTVTVRRGEPRYATHEAYAEAWMRDETPDCWRAL